MVDLYNWCAAKFTKDESKLLWMKYIYIYIKITKYGDFWFCARYEVKLAKYFGVQNHGFNCRPGPCEGVAGAMSTSRVVCKVVQFTVKQRQLHASPPANELSWLLEPKFLATPEICSSQSRVEVNLSRQRRFEVYTTQPGQCKTATPVLWIVSSDQYRVSIMYMISQKKESNFNRGNTI